MNEDMEDFQKRVKNAYIDENGMICLGWNKIHPNSPFGEDLMSKYPHIEKLYQEWEQEQRKKFSR